MTEDAPKIFDGSSPNARDAALLICEKVLYSVLDVVMEDAVLYEKVTMWFLNVVSQQCDPFSRGASYSPPTLPMNSECEVDIRKAFECIDLGENVPMAANELSPCPPRSDEGMLLFSEMTDIFAKYEGYRDLVIGKLIDILDDTESGLDISFLDRLFNPVTLSDSDAASALGSATRGFHVLAGVMWSCATFEYQCSIVRQVRQWRVAVGSDSWHKTACPGSKHVHVILNLGNAVSTIRGFFEGSNAGQSNGAPCVCPNSSGLPLANSLATLLRSQGHTQEKGAAEVKNVGARTVLYNITSGMLMYVQFYLSIRSLSAARRCARMAIQVSGQLQADEIIALSHYTYFNVNLCGGLVSEAADSISIALQISTSRKRNGEANICSLCYFGAAHLLLLHPSAAGAPLRTLLTGSVSSKIPASKQQKTSELSEMSTAPLIAVEQNTSQTVRQAIYSSEREAGALKGPELWTEVCLSVSRKTLLLIGSIYGMVCVPLNLDEHTISRLAHRVCDERGGASVYGMNALYCKEALLMELVRHCAYAALLTEEGLLLSLVDPIQILTDFCAAVKSVYASASVSAVVEANVFYACVLRYLVACALERDGYCALAYEALTGLVERLSVSCSSDSSAGGGEGSFWLSDHLMLLSFIQMRRAGLAVYLGVSEDIQRSAVALDELCSSYNFIFGILVSQLLEAHQLQVNGCHAAALSFLDKTISSASKIGIEVVVSRGLKLKVLSFSFLTEWPKSVATLEKLSNTATNDVSFVAALVNAEVEILLQSNTLESTNAANLLGDLEKLLTPNYLNPHNSYESNLKNLTKMRVSHRDIVALYATTIRVLTLLAHFDPEKYTPLKRRLLNQLKEAARSLERRHLYRGCGSGIANLPSKILYEALLHDELSKLVK